jgi:hypothetical protein
MFCQLPTVAEQLAAGTKDESIGGDESGGDESTGDESTGGDESVGGDEASGVDPSLEASGAESEPLDVAPQATSTKPRAP